jgi:hypothetical protein
MSEGLDHQLQLRALASAIDRICTLNCDLRSASPTVFDAVAVPSMSVHCYLVRLHRYTKFDFVCFHVAAWYLHRLCQQDRSFCPTMHNIHRLLITALLVSSKATDDIFHANVFMAQCGGIASGELNKLEVELCERLRWRLLPHVEEMAQLREAITNPQAGFWNCWLNGSKVASGTEEPGAHAAVSTVAAAPARLPHARSVSDSLSRLFRGGSSEGNLEAMGAAAAAVASHPDAGSAGKTAGKHDSGAVTGRSQGGSPRSIVSRTFSLSNLFGLASGW